MNAGQKVIFQLNCTFRSAFIRVNPRLIFGFIARASESSIQPRALVVITRAHRAKPFLILK